MGLIVVQGYGVSQDIPSHGFGGLAGPLPVLPVAPIIMRGASSLQQMLASVGYGGISIPVPPVVCIPFFFLDSVELKDDRTLRVRYTQPPKSGGASTSCTLLANYQLLRLDSLASPPAILTATLAEDDAEVVDLHLAGSLAPGSYALRIDPTVESAAGATITPPSAWYFVLALPVQTVPVEPGADALKGLFDNLHPAYRRSAEEQPIWRAICKALASGDATVQAAASAAIAQAQAATASDIYLTKRGGDQGVRRPAGVGMSDEAYRALVRAFPNRKVSGLAFWRLLEIFYGAGGARGYVQTTLQEPFVLRDDTTIELAIDVPPGSPANATVVLKRSDFRILRRATARELAAVITRQLPGGAFAVPQRVRGGGHVVRIYSGTRGALSSIAVVGGTSQPDLEFPGAIFEDLPPDPVATWTATPQVGDTLRWTPDSVAYFDLREVEAGDYLVVQGPQFANRGSWRVSAVRYGLMAPGDAWVEVEASGGVSETTVQCEKAEVRFYRAPTMTPRDNHEHSWVSQRVGDAHVSLAPTPRVVERGRDTAMYPRWGQGIDVTLARDSAGVVTVLTADPHGMDVGSQFEILDVEATDPPAPISRIPSAQLGGGSVVADTESGDPDFAPYLLWSEDLSWDGLYARGVDMEDGSVLITGGVRMAGSPTPRRQLVKFTTSTVTNPYHYQWSSSASILGLAAIGHAACSVTTGPHAGEAWQAGGYTGTPWDYLVATFHHSFAGVRLTSSLTAISSGGLLPAGVADAAAVPTPSGLIGVVGGSYVPNVGVVDVRVYDPVTNTIAATKTLNIPRLQPEAVALGGGDLVLVIGGRRPFTDRRAARIPGMLSWSFDSEGVGATTFSGPVTISSVSSPARPPGKKGWGLLPTAVVRSFSGAPQTTINDVLRTGDYVLTGWATAGTGVIFQVADVTTSPTTNTLICFGVDPTTRAFFIRWTDGSSVTHTLQTTTTVDLAWGSTNSLTYPRYHQWALVRRASGTQDFDLYLDGVLAQSWTGQVLPGAAGGAVCAFGAVNSQTGATVYSAFSGCVDEIGYAAATLTATSAIPGLLYRDEVGVTYDSPAEPGTVPFGTPLSSCEVVDLNPGGAGAAVLCGDMAVGRAGHGAVMLPDGRVLVVGGIGFDPTRDAKQGFGQQALELRSCEIWEPVTRTWTSVPDMQDPHSNCVVRLIGGFVYVAGGFTSKLVERLDLSTMRWSSAGVLLHVAGHAAGGVAYGSGAPVMMVAGGGDDSSGVTLATNRDMHGPVGGQVLEDGGVAGPHAVATVPGANTFTYKTPDHAWPTYAAAKLYPSAQPHDDEARGPYAFDPGGEFSVYEASTTVTEELGEGRDHPVIRVADSTSFPDEPAFVVFEFGEAGQVGPVRYLGREGSLGIVLDAGFVFPQTVPVGARVRLARRGGASGDGAPGQAWATGSSQGRVAAGQFVKDASAAGIELEIRVRYPSDRGLGGEGSAQFGPGKLSDIVEVYAGDEVDAELEEIRST